MDVSQLKSLVTISEVGSLARAAAILHLSQPAISSHIKQIEQELGLTLFTRHARGMRVTPEGERMVNLAKTALDAVQAMRDEARSMGGDLAGTLLIGMINNPMNERLPTFLKMLRERAPAVHVSLVPATSGEVLRRVLDGTFDAGFVEGEASGFDLAKIKLSDIEFVIVYPAAWEAVIAGSNPERILELPWVGTTDDCSFFRITNALFREKGRDFVPIVRTDHEALLLDLVSQGTGAALVRRDMVRHPALSSLVKVFPGSTVRTGTYFISAKSTSKQALVNLARGVLEELWA